MFYLLSVSVFNFYTRANEDFWSVLKMHLKLSTLSICTVRGSILKGTVSRKSWRDECMGH
jgi:hypothetical protein